MSQETIPAHPGYSALRFTFIDRKVTPEFVRAETQVRPVVAWRIVEGVVLPIALGDFAQGGDCVEAVLLPNGMVYDLSGRAFKGVDAFAQEVAKSWQAWRDKLPKEPTPLRPLAKGDVVYGSRQVGFIDPENIVA
jgi:hypothetical protein